jgi:hypothetical protein
MLIIRRQTVEATMAIRTALLTNFIAPYRLALLEALRDRVGELKIFVSTLTESDRPWKPNMGSLYVVHQKTKTLKWTRALPGYHQRLFIHFPYDTLVRGGEQLIHRVRDRFGTEGIDDRGRIQALARHPKAVRRRTGWQPLRRRLRLAVDRAITRQ